MRRFPLRSGLVIAVVAGALLAGGVAYATVPDSGGVIHGCYARTSSGQAQAGALRVIDTGLGQSCFSNENALSWSQQGPKGATGPQGPQGLPGTAGPTLLLSGYDPSVAVPGQTVITHTITPAEAGLSILTDSYSVTDLNGTTGGVTSVDCFLEINGSGSTHGVTISDDGSPLQGATASTTDVDRATLNAGDVVGVECQTPYLADNNEAQANADLLIEHVAS
jgi:hypothetical protein